MIVTYTYSLSVTLDGHSLMVNIHFGAKNKHKHLAAIYIYLSVFPSLCILCISQYCSAIKMLQIRLGRDIKVLQTFRKKF